MIKYNLTCECNYTFDSWFSSSEEFERLKKRKIITCTECNSNNINKSLMTPNISSLKKNNNNNNYKLQNNIKKKIFEYQKFIKDNFSYVGENFAQEARSIHYEDNKTKDDKKEKKGIYGKVTQEELKELNEEGIETSTIFWYDKTEN